MHTRGYALNHDFIQKAGNIKAEIDAKTAEAEARRLTLVITKDFSEWEIEMYINAIKSLDLDEIFICMSNHGSNKPRYKQVKEVEGALDAFATYICDESLEHTFEFDDFFLEGCNKIDAEKPNSIREEFKKYQCGNITIYSEV